MGPLLQSIQYLRVPLFSKNGIGRNPLRIFRVICLFLTFLCAGCSREGGSLANTIHELYDRPVVVVQPMEDLVGTPLSLKAATMFSQAINKRLLQKERLHLSSHKRDQNQFQVSLQLMQQEQTIQSPSEAAISVHIKIVDLRNEKAKIILQEILSINTLLDKPFLEMTQADLQGEQYRVSPMGLAEAKLARDIATRIEDYVLLAMKGK